MTSHQRPTRPRASAVLTAIAMVSVAWLFPLAPAARGATVCTWGGTPDAPTGVVTVEPGLTNTPSTEPHHLRATGELAGGPGCSGRMTFIGIAHAGGTCESVVFEGKVRGVPGVETFWGPGVAGLVQEFLYDRHGNVVGADQPQLLTNALNDDERYSHVEDCMSEDGFVRSLFSSTVEFLGR